MKNAFRALFYKSIRTLGFLLLVCTLLSYLCPFVSPSVFPYLVHFGTAFPVLALLNLFAALFFFWRGKKWAWVHVAALALGFSFLTRIVGMGLSMTEPNTDSLDFVVATHNLGGLSLPGKSAKVEAKNDSAFQVYRAFVESKGVPDIFCVQETRVSLREDIKSGFGYRYLANFGHGTGIFSRYPIVKTGEVEFENSKNSSIWADLEINGKLLRVYNIHLESNRVSDDTEKVMEKGDLKEKKTWLSIGELLKRVGSLTSKRAEQAKQIREHIAGCNHPVLLCGDFNDTQNSYVYRTLAEPMRDAFQEAGFGIGVTYAKFPPFLKIDHILYTPSLKAYTSTIFKEKISDHYPMYARIGF